MQPRRVYELSQPDFEQVVRLHQEILKESVLNRFGLKFLSIIYQTLISDPQNIFLVVKNQNQVIGFLAATPNINTFYRSVTKKHFIFLAVEVIKCTLFKPLLLFEVIKWVLAPKNSDKPFAELQFIAIKADSQGQGLGSKLINLLNKTFAQMDIKQYKVSTWQKNSGSNLFYKKMGFTFLNCKKYLGVNFNYYLSPKL